MPLFVISFEYLAKPLMHFWHTYHICRNLPFVNLASLSPHLRFYRSWVDSCSIPRFLRFAIFCENHQLSIWLFCCPIVSILAKLAGFAKYVIFVKPTIIDMTPLSSCSNFFQTLNKLFPFEYLAKPLMNFWHTRHFCRNLPFSPKFAIFSL